MHWVLRKNTYNFSPWAVEVKARQVIWVRAKEEKSGNFWKREWTCWTREDTWESWVSDCSSPPILLRSPLYFSSGFGSGFGCLGSCQGREKPEGAFISASISHASWCSEMMPAQGFVSQLPPAVGTRIYWCSLKTSDDLKQKNTD